MLSDGATLIPISKKFALADRLYLHLLTSPFTLLPAQLHLFLTLPMIKTAPTSTHRQPSGATMIAPQLTSIIIVITQQKILMGKRQLQPAYAFRSQCLVGLIF